MHDTALEGRHVVFLSWRDTRNPEGGGAEHYLEKMAAGLLARGAQVTVFCAAHTRAPHEEIRDGIRYVRAGSKTSVYLQGMLGLLRRRFGEVDLVVDVQNGLPFFSRLVTRTPVMVLVHHVHKEQWPVVYPGLVGRIGWWVERRLAPRLYRGCQYVTVSRATRDELRELGVGADRIAVVHNGTDRLLSAAVPRAPTPTVVVVGRLVPHKRVEQAIDAAVELRQEFPDLRLQVVGDGWWGPTLRQYALDAGAGDTVTFEGHVDDATKHAFYGKGWLLALPSLKEGWGLVIGEAGMHETPALAYRSAGGTRESIADGRSGLLVDDQAQFTAEMARLLRDHAHRSQLGKGAREMSHEFSWDRAQASFANVVAHALYGEWVAQQDPGEE